MNGSCKKHARFEGVLKKNKTDLFQMVILEEVICIPNLSDNICQKRCQFWVGIQK
jgi:hypothetical protein